MTPRCRIVTGFSLAFALFLPTMSMADQNIVTNPGFETGDFTGWTSNTFTNSTARGIWVVEPAVNGFRVPADTGSYFALAGCIGAPCISGLPTEQSSLSQALPTIAGQTYDLTFELVSPRCCGPNELEVLWNGSAVLDLGPGGTLGQLIGYNLFGVTNLTATSSISTLTFLDRNDPAWFGLDNVIVTSTPGTHGPPPVVTPEPSYVVLILGMCGATTLVSRLRHIQRS